MNRNEKFGRLLAIANTLGKKVFESDKINISERYMSRYSKNPARYFERIHKELLEYAPHFDHDEMYLLGMFEEIMSDMDEDEFNNKPLDAKYLYHYHSQQSVLNHTIGVDEASEILGLTPGTIKNKCASGNIEAKKIGKTWVIDKGKL